MHPSEQERIAAEERAKVGYVRPEEFPQEQRGDCWEEKAAAAAVPGSNGQERRPKEKASWPAPMPASALQLSQAQPWLWDGYLAHGSITLLSALWKAGKTTLLAHLLKAMEEGGEFCGRSVGKGQVLYVTEESENRWARRRDALGLVDNVHFLIRPFRGRPDWSAWADFTLYLSACVQRDPVDLVVLDPLVNLWPVRDENDNAQVNSALLPLYGVAEKNGLLLAHHVRKGDGQEGTASRGAGALTGFVDIIIELRRYNAAERKDCRRVLTGYGRDDETPDELVIELTEHGYQAHGDRGEVGILDLLPVIAGMLPDAVPGWTRNEVYDNWPEGKGKPHTARLLEALHRGARMGAWSEDGDGRRGSPYRFFRPLDQCTNE
jgi:hypothetical protein